MLLRENIRIGFKKITRSRMRLVIFGKNGQLAIALKRVLFKNFDLIFLDRNECNFLSLENINFNLNLYKPDIVINAVAYTDVDSAENDPVATLKINKSAVSEIAKYCAENNIIFLHYSSDYVFDGNKTGFYCEYDQCNPLNVYGYSKYAGEQAIIERFESTSQSKGKYIIVRSSWLYGDGDNFIKKILNLAYEKKELKVVCDQIGTPTCSEWLAMTTKKILSNEYLISGIYHATPSGFIDRHSFAKLIISYALDFGANLTLNIDSIIPVESSFHQDKAIRPKNSALSCKKLESILSSDCDILRIPFDTLVKSYLSKFIFNK